MLPLTGKSSKKEKMKMPDHTIFVDMRDHYDSALLTRFYNDLMIPNFPIADGTKRDACSYSVGLLFSPCVSCPW
jgi:hypothetical protein